MENPKVKKRVSLAPNASLLFPGNLNGRCCVVPCMVFRHCNFSFELDDVHDSGHDQTSVQRWMRGMDEHEALAGGKQENEQGQITFLHSELDRAKVDVE